MPGALTTLLANNAAHVLPGGRRKKTRKRRGGYTDQVVEAKEALDEIFNRWGCKTKDECLAKIQAKMSTAETEDELAPLRRDSRDIRVLSAFIGGRRCKTRRRF